MKKKLITIIVILLMILFATNIVQATNALNLQITLPDDLRNNMITEQTKQYYEQNHIYLHVTNEAQDETVMIIQLENELTRQIGTLKGLQEEKRRDFIEKYNVAKTKEEQSILKQEIYEKEDMLFIDTVYEKSIDDKTVQTEEYYTIYDGKTVIVSISFLNKNVNSSKVRQMIDNVKIESKENKLSFKDIIYLLAIPIILIILGVIYVIKEKKNKVHVEESEKVTILRHVTEHMNKMIDYSKFRGILILFTVTLILNILNLLFGVVDEITKFNWIGEEVLITKVYTAFVILQNAIQLIGVIYIAYRLTKKETRTIKKIKNTLIGMLIGVTLLTISRLIIQAIGIGINEKFIAYITYEASVFIKSMIYILIWYCYFRNSIRVSVYYQEKSLEQILIDPKKGYQNNLVNKKIMEYKIVEYFKKQKAFDYASGIYINKLPKEYASSLSLSDLNSKKVIRLKKAKYYLSRKDLDNPKTERRKITKTISLIVIIYICIMLILYI